MNTMGKLTGVINDWSFDYRDRKTIVSVGVLHGEWQAVIIDDGKLINVPINELYNVRLEEGS